MVVVCQSAELKTFEAFQAQKVTIEELREKCHDQQSVNNLPNSSSIEKISTVQDPDQKEISKKISRTNGYRCDDCGYQSTNFSATWNHVESHHLDHTYRCKKCGTVTNTWSSYLRHVRLKHMIRKT